MNYFAIPGIDTNQLSLESICVKLDTSVEQLSDKVINSKGVARNQPQDNALRCYILWNYLSKTMNYTEIGKMFNRSRSTVSVGVKKYNTLISIKDDKLLDLLKKL